MAHSSTWPHASSASVVSLSPPGTSSPSCCSPNPQVLSTQSGACARHLQVSTRDGGPEGKHGLSLTLHPRCLHTTSSAHGPLSWSPVNVSEGKEEGGSGGDLGRPQGRDRGPVSGWAGRPLGTASPPTGSWPGHGAAMLLSSFRTPLKIRTVSWPVFLMRLEAREGSPGRTPSCCVPSALTACLALAGDLQMFLAVRRVQYKIVIELFGAPESKGYQGTDADSK